MPSRPQPSHRRGRGTRTAASSDGAGARRPPPTTLLVCLAAILISALVSGTLVTPPAGYAAPEEDETPLSLTLDDLDTVELGGSGPIEMSGTITNHDDEAWENVDIYPLVGNAPITSMVDLAEQNELPPTAYVGDRILTDGDYDRLDRIEPGETLEWSIRLPRSDITDAEATGVYWFGAHAIIPQGEEVSVADGRTRTFLPRVDEPPPAAGTGRNGPPGGSTSGPDGESPRGNTRANGPPSAPSTAPEKSQIAMVVPIRRRVAYTPDGRVAHVDQWAKALRPNGRLGRLLAVGNASARLTWLIDPAVLDAIQHLADGNVPRDLGPTDSTEESTGPSPSESSDEESATAAEATADAESDSAQDAAAAWLEQLPSALSANQVLALPYGDPDLPALAENDPGLYLTARDRGRQVFDELEIATEPAVAPPSGYLDTDSLTMLIDNPVVLLSERALSGSAPATATLEGQQVVTTSALATEGGPGPGDPFAPVAIRQQAVAVAALQEEDRPVVVLLPDEWSPPAASSDFLAPIAEADWVELAPLGEATADVRPARLPSDRLVYPDAEAEAQMEDSRFPIFDELISSGRTLQRILTHNDEVGGEIVDEALTSMSYAAREGGTRAALASQRALDALLGKIRVVPPPRVTLSSDSGDFSATVVNDLEQPITVALDATSPGGMTIEVPDGPLEIPGRGRSTVLVRAQAETNGVHTVTLTVTDSRGESVGRSGTVPIRTGQVSVIIWWFIAVGCGLLFLAIAVRLVRRFRGRGRADGGSAGELEADPDPAADPAADPGKETGTA